VFREKSKGGGVVGERGDALQQKEKKKREVDGMPLERIFFKVEGKGRRVWKKKRAVW